MDRKTIKGALQFVLLFAVLALLLVACGDAGATQPSQVPVGATNSPQMQTDTPSTSAPSSTPSAIVTPAKPASPLTAIRMLYAKNGWALTKNTVLKTADGGVHWNDVTPANAGLNQSARGQFMNTETAWIAIGPANQQEGSGISVLSTADGGGSWQRSVIPDPEVSLVDVPHFITTKQGWLALSSTPGAGSARTDIWYTNSGGYSWTQLASNKSINDLNLGYVTGISFGNAQVGIAAGNLGAGGDNTVPSITLTRDGGQSWQTKSLPHLLGGYVNPMSTSQPPVFFGNVVVLPVTVTGPNGPLLVLYRSTDGGPNWLQTSTVSIQADNTYVVDPSHAWATDTQSGKLYSTNDGGDHWPLASNTAYQLHALSFIDAQNGWGVTGQQLLQTTDGGKTWQPIPFTINRR